MCSCAYIPLDTITTKYPTFSRHSARLILYSPFAAYILLHDLGPSYLVGISSGLLLAAFRASIMDYLEE